MQEIERFDTEELQAELEKRKREAEEKARPKPLEEPDWSHVQRMCIHEIQEMAEKGYNSKDADHYIYEAAMEAVFGRGVWVWVNEKLR